MTHKKRKAISTKHFETLITINNKNCLRIEAQRYDDNNKPIYEKVITTIQFLKYSSAVRKFNYYVRLLSVESE